MSYTRELSTAEPAASIRKARGAIGASRLRDGILGVLSVPWAVVCATFMAGGTLLLLPFVLSSLRRGRAANRSTEGGGSLTAVKTLTGRAVAAACGFGPDTLAPRFRAGLSPFEDSPGCGSSPGCTGGARCSASASRIDSGSSRRCPSSAPASP